MLLEANVSKASVAVDLMRRPIWLDAFPAFTPSLEAFLMTLVGHYGKQGSGMDGAWVSSVGF